MKRGLGCHDGAQISNRSCCPLECCPTKVGQDVSSLCCCCLQTEEAPRGIPLPQEALIIERRVTLDPDTQTAGEKQDLCEEPAAAGAADEEGELVSSLKILACCLFKTIEAQMCQYVDVVTTNHRTVSYVGLLMFLEYARAKQSGSDTSSSSLIFACNIEPGASLRLCT